MESQSLVLSASSLVHRVTNRPGVRRAAERASMLVVRTQGATLRALATTQQGLVRWSEAARSGLLRMSEALREAVVRSCLAVAARLERRTTPEGRVSLLALREPQSLPRAPIPRPLFPMARLGSGRFAQSPPPRVGREQDTEAFVELADEDFEDEPTAIYDFIPPTPHVDSSWIVGGGVKSSVAGQN